MPQFGAASLTDEARVTIHDCNVLIKLATKLGRFLLSVTSMLESFLPTNLKNDQRYKH
jgi:hypothetical protein